MATTVTVEALIKTPKIDDPQLEPPPLPLTGRRCIYYREKICLAPKIIFEVCKTCYRINPRFVIRNLFEKIKALAIFFLPGMRLSSGSGGIQVRGGGGK